MATKRPIQILHIEDNPGDIRLVEIALNQIDTPTHVSVITDGDAAISHLKLLGNPENQKLWPDLILLDINLPKCDGREVLREIKTDAVLKTIPVIVLTSSDSEEDIQVCYELHANSYIRKSETLDEFLNVFCAIDRFWMKTARIPSV